MGASGTVKFNVQDQNGNSMAAGTTIAVSLDNTNIGTVTQTPTPFVVGCNADLGGQDYQVSFAASATNKGSGNLTVQVTSPDGTLTLFTVALTVT